MSKPKSLNSVSPIATDKSGGGEHDPRPLPGDWRHDGRLIYCGTLRVLRADFDTNPSNEFVTEVFDWLVKVLNTRASSSTATAEQTAREIVRVAHNITRDCLSRTCFRVDCSRKDCWGCDGFNAAVERVAAIQSSVATVSPGTEPWFDAGGCAWEIRRSVDCVECPHCAFTFAAVHTSGDSNGYECPACEGCSDNVPVVSPDAPQLKAIERLHLCPKCDAACFCKNARDADNAACSHCSVSPTEAQARDKDTTEAEAIASYYPNVKGSEKIALVEDIKEALTTARRETSLHSRFSAGTKAADPTMRDLYDAAKRAGLSSAENRSFEEWEARVSDFGLDDARQAWQIESEHHADRSAGFAAGVGACVDGLNKMAQQAFVMSQEMALTSEHRAAFTAKETILNEAITTLSAIVEAPVGEDAKEKG